MAEANTLSSLTSNGRRLTAARHVALPGLFVLLNSAPLVACFEQGVSRHYYANLDFALVLGLSAVKFKGRILSSIWLSIIFLMLATILSLDLFIALSDSYNHGVFGGSQYAAGFAYWPWSLFLPWLAFSFAASATSTALIAKSQATLRISGLALLVSLIFGADVLAGNTHLLWRSGTYLPNLASSSSLRFLKGEELTNGLKSATTIATPTMASRLAGMTSPPRNILSVAVESLGLPASGGGPTVFERQLLAGLGPDYEMSYSESHRFGGTTLQGELRELCGVAVLGMPKRPAEFARLGVCLPQKLKQIGYDTVGYHGNSGDFYHRAAIYPVMGLSRSRFRDSLVRADDICDRYMFKGVCDTTVFQSAMTEFAAPGRHFVHIMTLDTHFPQPADPAARCADSGREAQELCLYQWYFARAGADLARAISQAQVKPDLVVIYGDHAPPFADHNRAKFSAVAVPYVEIRKIR